MINKIILTISFFLTLLVLIFFWQKIPQYPEAPQTGEIHFITSVGNSMGYFAPSGTELFVLTVDYGDLNVGDDIVYWYKKSTFEEPYLVHHRIIKKSNSYVVTQGVGNDSSDRWATNKEHIKGLVVAHNINGTWIILKDGYNNLLKEYGIELPKFYK